MNIKPGWDVVLGRNDKGEGGKGRFLLCRLCGEKKRRFGEVRKCSLESQTETFWQLYFYLLPPETEGLFLPVFIFSRQVSAAGGRSPISSAGPRRQRVPGERRRKLKSRLQDNE